MTSNTRDTIREPLRMPWDVIRAHSPLYASTQRDCIETRLLRRCGHDTRELKMTRRKWTRIALSAHFNSAGICHMHT
jgi:hypothetical protein